MSAVHHWRVVKTSPAAFQMVSISCEMTRKEHMYSLEERSSFRYEVQVTTPHFEMSYPGRAKESLQRVIDSKHSFLRSKSKPEETEEELWYTSEYPERLALIGTENSRKSTFSRKSSPRGEQFEDAVTWLSLLEDIHVLQALMIHGRIALDSAKRTPPGMLLICVTQKTRSWDCTYLRGMPIL